MIVSNLRLVRVPSVVGLGNVPPEGESGGSQSTYTGGLLDDPSKGTTETGSKAGQYVVVYAAIVLVVFALYFFKK